MELQDFFHEHPKAALGFSGGVDSSYLLWAARQCGADVRPYYIKTSFQPEFEFEDAKRLCREIGAELTVLELDALSDPAVAANPADRCYHCKRNLFGTLAARALVSTKREIPLLFEDLKIHNRLARPQDSESIDKHLSYRPDICLDHNQNGFSISFAALDYCEYERVHYYYKMDGFDKYWIDARNNREAYYANLPAGTYTFKVKITNNDKSIVERENSIRVIVKPAPWQTWWAWCIYLLIAAAIIGIFIRAWLRIKQEKETTRRAKLEKEQEQRVNRMNMSFFANISHEFRTPLTMISGPVTQLCESPKIEGENKQLLYIVQRSVGRMLRLVNQLMDFNKLENDTLKLRVKRTDIISQLQRFVDIFRINANEKGIALNTYGLEDTFLMWLDVDKLDKIVGNLLSNALKFTPNGGKVELCFDVITREEAARLFTLTDKDIDTQYVKVAVADSGNGIPEEQLEKVFERKVFWRCWDF